MSLIKADQGEGSALTDIEISAYADRRTLEAVYLQLRELAAKNGLKVEYRLSVSKPEGQSKS